jgi:hypothetical protein
MKTLDIRIIQNHDNYVDFEDDDSVLSDNDFTIKSPEHVISDGEDIILDNEIGDYVRDAIKKKQKISQTSQKPVKNFLSVPVLDTSYISRLVGKHMNESSDDELIDSTRNSPKLSPKKRIGKKAMFSPGLSTIHSNDPSPTHSINHSPVPSPRGSAKPNTFFAPIHYIHNDKENHLEDLSEMKYNNEARKNSFFIDEDRFKVYSIKFNKKSNNKCASCFKLNSFTSACVMSLYYSFFQETFKSEIDIPQVPFNFIKDIEHYKHARGFVFKAKRMNEAKCGDGFMLYEVDDKLKLCFLLKK